MDKGSEALTRAMLAALLLLLAAGCASTRPGETTFGTGDTHSAGERIARAPGISAPSVSGATVPSTTVRLRWTMPDSVEWRRPGFGRADSAAVAQSGQSGEVWWVPRFGPPYWPPVYAESLIYTTGHRFPGSAVDVTVATPGHGALFVRARNAAGAWPVRSNLTHARTSE